MKVVILAGGLGSRMNEQTRTKSKALAEIGGHPILWHLLNYYHHYGFNEFVIALGTMADSVREYFEWAGYRRIRDNSGEAQYWYNDSVRIDLVDTGANTENGGRIKRLASYLEDATFMLTWCDGLANVDLNRLRMFHQAHGRLATLSAVHPPGRFGRLTLQGDRVCDFNEKATSPDEWINGAFFVLEPGVLTRIAGDETQFEQDTLPGLAHDGELMAYRHDSFWQCMDTVKEQRALDDMWRRGVAPWLIWSRPVGER